VGRWFIGAGLALLCVTGAFAQAPNTLVVAVQADPGQLNPAISTASPVHAVADSIFNGLVALDAETNPLPDLAQRWEMAEDGLQYRFILARNAKWHDGKPVTAADVKFSFEEVLLKKHDRTRASLAPVLDIIEAVDDNTVLFRLKRPYPALLQQLDATEAPILPKHIYGEGEIEKNAANLNPVGSGAWRFESYRKDNSVVLVRNADYFKPGLPKFDRLVFRIIPDATTQVQALLRGEVDFVGRLPPSEIKRVEESGAATLMDVKGGPGGSNCIMTIGLNLDRPALQKLEVRQALSAAIDRRAFVSQILFNRGRAASAPISSGIPWAHAAGTLPASADTARATTLLEGAGLKAGANGERLSLDIVQFATFSRYADLLRQQFAAVGVQLKPRLLDPAAMSDAVFTKRDFDLTLISYCNGNDPEIGVRRMYVSSNIGNIPFSNASAYRNAEVDGLFGVAGNSVDRQKRADAYKSIQQIAARDLPYIWLVETDFTSAWRKDLTGFTPWSGQFAEQAARK
jgi:peptide/nickel transport system substrate-binding protein